MFQSGQTTWYIREQKPPRPNPSKLRIHELSGKIAVPPIQPAFSPEINPHDSLDPLRDAPVQHPLCSDTPFLTSLQILKPTRYSNSSSAYGRQACFAPFPLFVMANVDGWIDFLLPLRRSLGGFGGVDVEEGGPGLGRYRHDTCYQAPNTTTSNSNTLDFTYSCYLSPFTEHQGAVDAKG